jgi:hypothetical protein
VDTHQAFKKAFIGMKKAGGYPPSILKAFYWHKKGCWITTKHFKSILLTLKRLVDTHQAFKKAFIGIKKSG